MANNKERMRTTTVVSLILVSLLLGCSDMGDEVIDSRNKILFTSARSGKEQLYMMNPDGTNIRQLTFGPFSHGAGRWSPDATQIVCNTEEGSTTAGLMMVVMDVDGTNRRMLRYGSEMSWSPDGKRITFSHCPSCELYDRSHYIYVINADGTNFVQLTHDRGVQDDAPAWSPDGTTIAFSSNRDYPTGPLRSEIYLMNSDGSNQRRLTYADSLIVGLPSWSPDGMTIAFRASGEIGLISNEGQNFHMMTKQIKSGGDGLTTPRWSPNGRQLVLWGYTRDGSAFSFIYLINADGTGLQRISTDRTSDWPDWSW
jgi:Tol biopolymer transport system component